MWASPAPFRPITTLEPVEELLVMVNCPFPAPATVGSNWTFSVNCAPGFNVTGQVSVEMVNPVPLKVAPPMVTGAEPVEVSVNDCVAEVFTTKLPNPTLVALMLSVGTAAFSCRTLLAEVRPMVAFSVTDWVIATADTVAVNPVLVAPIGTVTDAGNVTAALLLVRITLSPPPGAGLNIVTVQASFAEPVSDPLLQFSAANPCVCAPKRAMGKHESSIKS